MIVDTSAIVAILLGEPDADEYVLALARGQGTLMSAGTYLEAAIVVDANHDPVLSARLDELIETARIGIEPVTQAHADIARQAYRDFGRSSGHAAGLNFGDCFAYALSRASGAALLYKGADFTETDLASVLSH